jgi:putative SbcD/Mre11-related phosphoesterase
MVMEMSLPGGFRLNADYAVYVESERVLAIADLHLGYEASLQVQHVAIPRFQLDVMLPRLERLLETYEPSKIIINGDLKHEFSRNIGQEWDEVEALVRFLGERTELVVVRGNHDNYLKNILARAGIEMVESYKTKDGLVEFVHGHKYSGPWDRFRIYAHEHPFVRLRDEIGALISLPCFLYDVVNNFLLMPAFSPLASGTNIIVTEDHFMIKGLRGLNLSTARVLVIGEDGLMDFGEVGRLRAMQENNEIAEEHAK